MGDKGLFTVKTSAIHGKGLFATQDIKQGTFLGKCETRKTKEVGMYTLWLEDGAQPVDVTCHLKYINHSKKPNVAYYDDLTVQAIRSIQKGEELVHDYGDEWF